MRHSFKIGGWLGFAAALVLATPLYGHAGSPQGGDQTANPPATVHTTHQILLTGCLKRGNQQGTYVMTDQNGTTWELVSGNADVDLSKHIFHAVSVAGKEVPTSQPPDQSPQANNPVHQLRVLTLQVLSRSCTR